MERFVGLVVGIVTVVIGAYILNFYISIYRLVTGWLNTTTPLKGWIHATYFNIAIKYPATVLMEIVVGLLVTIMLLIIFAIRGEESQDVTGGSIVYVQ
ncbi:MAG: hypothetical protein JHC26_01485 [Thermofilum sp.]|jgi:hypothetical protein|uniref:hypothetical protein n=1 Tax=Thermofilum sp. TaxID=1961369 RepID=UPI0025846996|nr:hypothetical protein [Thermofilum sp.]MCI4407733.1 hypothetical protein [Thermofilum sp.]